MIATRQPRLRTDVGRNRNINFLPNIRLWSAAKSGDLREAKLAIREGASAKYTVAFGHTPLHRAAEYDRVEVAELLVLEGADVLAQNSEGKTATDVAKAKGNVRTRQALKNAAQQAARNATQMKEGERCLACRQGTTNQFPGVITRARRSGTYDVMFEDGSKESNIPRANVRAYEDRTVFKTFGASF